MKYRCADEEGSRSDRAAQTFSFGRASAPYASYGSPPRAPNKVVHAFFSIRKQEVNKLCFCRPANVVLSFWNPLSDQTAQTRFTTFWYYHVVIQQTICACRRLFAPFRLRRHSPMVFVYRRIYVRAPIRLRRCISAAWTTHPCSLISPCDVHGVAEFHDYMRVLQVALSRSLINVFTVRMANVNDLWVKTTLHVCRLCWIWPTEVRVFHTCHRNIHVSRCQKGDD